MKEIKILATKILATKILEAIPKSRTIQATRKKRILKIVRRFDARKYFLSPVIL